jgi:hypothetical protein
MSSFSTFLFARASFSEGAARLLDFGDTLLEYSSSETGEAADAVAFACDWRQIAQDMWEPILREKAAGVQSYSTSVQT